MLWPAQVHLFLLMSTRISASLVFSDWFPGFNIPKPQSHYEKHHSGGPWKFSSLGVLWHALTLHSTGALTFSVLWYTLLFSYLPLCLTFFVSSPIVQSLTSFNFLTSFFFNPQVSAAQGNTGKMQWLHTFPFKDCGKLPGMSWECLPYVHQLIPILRWISFTWLGSCVIAI